MLFFNLGGLEISGVRDHTTRWFVNIEGFHLAKKLEEKYFTKQTINFWPHKIGQHNRTRFIKLYLSKQQTDLMN